MSENMKLTIKYLFIRFSRMITGCIHIFPMQKKKIIFSSFGGLQKSCNPFYIQKSIEQKFPNRFKIIWVKNMATKQNFDDVNTVNYGSYKYIYHLLTAACVVTNDTLPSYLNFSNRQLVINTWHGGGLFKQTFGNSSEAESKYNYKINKLHNKDTNLYIISSESWNENVVKRRFLYNGDVLKCGMPRNDIFFLDNSVIKAKVKRYFNIPSEYGIVLYAPTFRGASSSAAKGVLYESPINISKVLGTLKIKYGRKFCFIFREHHLLANTMQDCLNGSNYPDMQELLAAADVFISDYSSCLWDFSFTNRPSFIYAPDFDKYSKRPGFESDYHDWPFAIARDNNELSELILSFDENNYKEKCDSYHESYGSYEKGNASDTTAEFIAEKILKCK